MVLIIGSLTVADRVLCVKTEHGASQARKMYDQPRNTIDVVFMGSSHIHCDINTALLWEEYGIASYDYSAAEQPLWITYHYLKEICKYQDPKLVVLDLYCPARFKADYQYDWLRDNLEGVKFSVNKLEMLAASCESDKWLEYFPDFAAYHERYRDVTSEDFEYLLSSKEERQSFKGYTPYFNVQPQAEPELNENMSGGITIKSEEYLQKIIEYTKKHDIELFLIVSPYITTSEDELVYNRVHEIADRYDIRFNSTNYFYDEMKLDFDLDFNDQSHLNYNGGCKFTRYLGNEIKENYAIKDRRGKKRWESWDRHVEKINSIVKKQ